MISKVMFTFFAALLLHCFTTAQVPSKPQNADQERAWRLYNQYIQSEQKEALIKEGLKKIGADIKTANVGIIPGVYIDPKDIAEQTRLKKDLAAEEARQKNLEAAWDKSFAKYGKLTDSSRKIYDPKTKTTMDRIRFRLIYEPAPATKTPSPAQKGDKAEYAWVFLMIVDYENADRWATADAHPSYVVKHRYARGVYSAITTYEGSDPDRRGLRGTLGVKAVFTSVPKIIYPDQPVSLNLSFTATENSAVKLAFSGTASADFDKWDVGPGGVTSGSRSFVNKAGNSSFTISTSNNAPSYNETLTARLGSGTKGGRIALRTRLSSMGVPMGTNYIYEWKQVGK